MPLSIFKSKPKTDRRIQWRNLKAKHAKTISQKKIKIEVGLGKALDAYYKEVEWITGLNDSRVNEAAFARFLAKARPMRTLAKKAQDNLRSKDWTGLKEIDKFLQDLQNDVAWWEKASKEVGTMTRKEAPKLSAHDAHTLEITFSRLRNLYRAAQRLDALLQVPLKKTKTYTPPESVLKWAKESTVLRSNMTKFEMLAKSPNVNLKPLVQLIESMHANVTKIEARAQALTDVHGVAPVNTTWNAVEAQAEEVRELAEGAENIIRYVDLLEKYFK